MERVQFDNGVEEASPLQILNDRRRFICIAAVVCGLVATGLAWIQDDKFEASTTLAFAMNGSVGSKSSGLTSQLGGLASLAGLSMASDSNKAEALAVLQSRVLTERFVTENGLMPILFADQWDSAAKRWKTNGAAPSAWKANELFEKIREVSEDRRTGLITVSINWRDPVLCARWANGLVKMADDALRHQAVEDSTKHIEYLTQQAKATEVAQLRVAIFSVLESEIKNVMFANGPGNYALKVIDPAQVPERKVSPQRLVWTVAGVLVGFVAAVAFVLMRANLGYRPTER
jgi:uncharacterized protein involved in exopolysaccharide biosynthesis